MSNIPYDIVLPEVERIIIRMALATSWDQSHYYWMFYINYINACGWTDAEFTKETLRRIDIDWLQYFIWN